MAKLAFEDLSFAAAGDVITIHFLGYYSFELPRTALEQMGLISIEDHALVFDNRSEKEARNKFNHLLDHGFLSLRNDVTGKPTTYIHSLSGIPLIGNGSFGIVDRNSNMIEVKPLTGCNMNCIFCSVDEGLSSRKTAEMIIQSSYLADELGKLLALKNRACHITINAQGEPTLYAPMAKLIRSISSLPHVKSISLITNGTLLTESDVDALAAAGLTRLNLSLNAVTDRMAKILEGHGKYDVSKVKALAKYAAKKLEVMLAPVFVPGYNDDELKQIVLFAKRIGARVGIQNFLTYKKGRTPQKTRQMPWENFYALLRNLEAETGVKLLLNEKDFDVRKTPALPKPFRKGKIVEAVLKCPGRYRGEVIASAGQRSVTVTPYAFKSGDREKRIRIRITSDKHNIFFGKPV
jgi:uncharacterized protein